MNYLKQIRAFDSWEELNPLSDKSYRLWYKLMAIANTQHWPDELSVPILKLQSELHTTSKQTVINARNSLVQAGRIQVTKGKHGKAALYRIIPFPEENVGLPSGRDSGKESGRGNGLPSGRDSGTYIKQNKTKQNKKSLIKDQRPNLAKIFELWQANWGFPNSIAQQDLTEWAKEFGVELVEYAIKRALKRNINSRGADGYLERTFQAYRKDGIDSVKAAQEATERNQQRFSREQSANRYGRQHIEEPLPSWAKQKTKPLDPSKLDPKIFE